MDYKRLIGVCSGLALVCSVILGGCNKHYKEDDPIRNEESFLQEFRAYLAERGNPNLIIARFKTSEVYCKDSKFIETLGIYEICHSFDDRIHPGDLLMRRSHFEGNEQMLYRLDLWLKGTTCGGARSLEFFPLKDDDIDYVKEERLVPNDPNTKRRLYYVRDLVPMTLSNLYPVAIGQMNDNQVKGVENAINAYFALKEEYRKKNKTHSTPQALPHGVIY